MRLIKLFKYELIKIIIFLFLFFFSLIFVLSGQESYYYKNGANRFHGKDYYRIERLQE